jgi:REP element-mobilizing transposase RayT
MPNTYSKMYCQAVFAVKYRKAVIEDSFKSELYGVIGNLINETGAKTLIVNGHFDHVHCLFRFFPKHSVSEIMKNAKSKSSKWLNEPKLLEHRFEWQSAFGSFTYSEKEIATVFDYVKNQETHHQKMTFKEEYLMMLKAHNVEFLPEYLFKELE